MKRQFDLTEREEGMRGLFRNAETVDEWIGLVMTSAYFAGKFDANMPVDLLRATMDDFLVRPRAKLKRDAKARSSVHHTT